MASDPAPGPVLLIGGGWDPAAGRRLYGALLAACEAARPQVACVVLDEGDGTEQFGRWAGALSTAGPCDPVPVLVSEGGTLDIAHSLPVGDPGDVIPAYEERKQIRLPHTSRDSPQTCPARPWLGTVPKRSPGGHGWGQSPDTA